MKKLTSVMLVLCLCLTMAGGTVPAFAEEQRTVYASTMEELQAAIQSNTTIILEGKDYVGSLHLGSYIEAGPENVTIQGTGATRILLNSWVYGGEDDAPWYDSAVQIENCKNITLRDLVLEQAIDNAVMENYSLVSPVVSIGNTPNVTIENCTIQGGITGLNAAGGVVTVRNSTFQNIGWSAARLLDGGMFQPGADNEEHIPGVFSFQNCAFSNNGTTPRFSWMADYEFGNKYAFETYGYEVQCSVTFDTCTFSGNRNPYFLNSENKDIFESISPEGTVIWKADNCTFFDNNWTAP